MCSAKREIYFPSIRHGRSAVYSLLTIFFAFGAVGCRQDMHNQPKFTPLRGTTAFRDSRSARPQVPGTVARSQGISNDYFHTGLMDGAEGDGMPLPVTTELLQRGQERYNVYCTPCHSRTGYGHGMVVQRGYHPAASYHTDRLRKAPLGHFFSVITNGYGAMPNYAAELRPEDRWAIVSYIRALQLSQNAKESDVAPGTVVTPLSEAAARHGFDPSTADLSFWHAGEKLVPQQMLQNSTGHAVAAHAIANSAKEGDESKATSVQLASMPKAHSGSATAGKEVYQANCVMCHQANLVGLPPMFPPLVGVVGKKGEAHARNAIINGAPDATPMMPGFGDRISATDIDNLIAYLKSAKP